MTWPRTSTRASTHPRTRRRTRTLSHESIDPNDHLDAQLATLQSMFANQGKSDYRENFAYIKP